MDTKTTGWVSYLTFIGWIVAFAAGDKEGAKFHLNQSLVIWLGYICAVVVMIIPILGWLLGFVAEIYLFVMWIMGLIAAINQEEKELPLIGKIKLLK